jgi:hypothetical protein
VRYDWNGEAGRAKHDLIREAFAYAAAKCAAEGRGLYGLTPSYPTRRSDRANFLGGSDANAREARRDEQRRGVRPGALFASGCARGPLEAAAVGRTGWKRRFRGGPFALRQPRRARKVAPEREPRGACAFYQTIFQTNSLPPSAACRTSGSPQIYGVSGLPSVSVSLPIPLEPPSAPLQLYRRPFLPGLCPDSLHLVNGPARSTHPKSDIFHTAHVVDESRPDSAAAEWLRRALAGGFFNG